MRNLVTMANIGDCTQGAIFNCLKISGNRRVHGLVISARCDIAQKKSKTILCLPVLTLEDWINSVGSQEVLAQGSKAVIKNVSEILARYGLPIDSFTIYGYENCLSVLDRKKINAADRQRIEVLRAFIESGKIVKSAKSFKDAHNKILETILKNTRADCHFLERIHVDCDPTGYVADFTQPITLYRDVIDELSMGLDKFYYDRDKDFKYGAISLDEIDSGEIISILNSPFVEHLLQRFTHYYSRIGTKDISDNDLNNLKVKHEIA